MVGQVKLVATLFGITAWREPPTRLFSPLVRGHPLHEFGIGASFEEVVLFTSGSISSGKEWPYLKFDENTD